MGVAIRRVCDLCGKPYVARSKASKFCSAPCRNRSHKGKPPVFKPRPVVVDSASGVTSETVAALAELGKTNTPEGQAALVLAAKIDAGIDPLSAITSAVKQLGDTLADLRRAAPALADPLAEARKKFSERRQTA